MGLALQLTRVVVLVVLLVGVRDPMIAEAAATGQVDLAGALGPWAVMMGLAAVFLLVAGGRAVVTLPACSSRWRHSWRRRSRWCRRWRGSSCSGTAGCRSSPLTWPTPTSTGWRWRGPRSPHTASSWLFASRASSTARRQRADNSNQGRGTSATGASGRCARSRGPLEVDRGRVHRGWACPP